jgi:23S rRNA pseudouridine2605 synthase
MDSNDNPAQDGERVAKVIARAGLCSRREAEGWITAGRVSVNGTVITTPALDVTPADVVAVDGQPLPEKERTRLFLYHKPRGLVTTNNDPEGRPTIFQALPGGLPRLISIGRLDLASEGLLLLTNDGALARALELPTTGWRRHYRVRAHGTVEQRRLDKLRKGITVDGMRYGPIEASIDTTTGGANMWLNVAIREGKNREVRNVMQALGLAVNRLIRVAFGPFQLGDLPEGAIDEVTTRALREALGDELAAKIGVDFSGPVHGHSPGRMESPVKFKPSRRERFEEKEREAHSDRDERPARSRRDDRGDDRRGDRRDERRSRDARPDDRPAEGEAPPRKKIGRHHGDTRVWRGGDAPLRRKFHGARSERREEEKPSGPKRAGVVADRKGRQVMVERFGEPKTEELPKKKSWGAAPARGGERNDRRGTFAGGREERGRGHRSDERPRGNVSGERGPRKFGDQRAPRKFGDGDRPRKFGGDRPRGDRPRDDRPRGGPGGGRSFGRRPPRRDRSGGPRPSRPKT